MTRIAVAKAAGESENWRHGFDAGPPVDPRRFRSGAAEDSRRDAEKYLRASGGGDARQSGLYQKDAVQRQGRILLEWAAQAGRLIVPDLLEAVKFEQGEHEGFYDQTS